MIDIDIKKHKFNFYNYIYIKILKKNLYEFNKLKYINLNIQLKKEVTYFSFFCIYFFFKKLLLNVGKIYFFLKNYQIKFKSINFYLKGNLVFNFFKIFINNFFNQLEIGYDMFLTSFDINNNFNFHLNNLYYFN